MADKLIAIGMIFILIVLFSMLSVAIYWTYVTGVYFFTFIFSCIFIAVGCLLGGYAMDSRE